MPIKIQLLTDRKVRILDSSNLIIAAENSATAITVSYPCDYETYSKRVDFLTSQGKDWTIALYTPEYQTYKPDFNKNNFAFSLPSEVTACGELKLQFLAYLPDETEKTVPFETVPLFIQDGIIIYKKNTAENPDLLIRSYRQSSQALESSAVAVETANTASEKTDNAIDTANSAKLTAEKAQTAAEEAQTSATQSSSDAKLAAQAAEDALETVADTEAKIADALEQIVATDDKAVDAQTNALKAIADADTAIKNADEAFDIASQSTEQSATAIATAESAVALSESAIEKATTAEQASTTANTIASAAEKTAKSALEQITALIETAEAAEETAQTALTTATESDEKAAQAIDNASAAKGIAEGALTKADSATETAAQAKELADSAVTKANTAIDKGKANESDIAAIKTGKADSAEITRIDGRLKTIDETQSDMQSAVDTLGETIASEQGRIDTLETSKAPISHVGAGDTQHPIADGTTAGFSLNNYSAEEKGKLSGIEAGAQVNTITGIKGNEETEYRVGNINISKAHIGLTNADNTSDADKPISTAAQAVLNTKVDNVEGKELSDENYTAEEKQKLSGIESGAQVNIQSDWNESDSSTQSYINNKPTSMPAIDVSDWAKATDKPSYTANEVGAVPSNRTVNGKALDNNIILTAADTDSVPTARTVNGYALSANIGLQASDVGAVPTSRTVNSKPLTGNIALTASDVSAVPTSRTVNNKELSSNVSLTAADVSAVPTSRTVNNKELSSNISLTSADVSAVPTTRKINNKALISDITITAEDVGAITSIPIATTSTRGVAYLGATNGAARYGQKADAGLGNLDNIKQYSPSNMPFTAISSTISGGLGSAYTQLANNLVLQWGCIFVSGSSQITVDLQKAYKDNSSYIVVATENFNGNQTGQPIFIMHFNSSQFILQCSKSAMVNWIAIGQTA